MPDKFDNTQEWQDKNAGEEYNQQLDYYNRTDLNWNFYNKKQWIGVKTGNLPEITMPVCHTAVDYLVASLMSREIKAEFNADNVPTPLKDDQSPEAEQYRQIKKKLAVLNEASSMKWEKEKMNWKLRQLLYDGACSGDFAVHVYWDSSVKTGQDETGDFRTDMIDGANVMFGNPNLHEVEDQPYILLTGRDTVEHLKREAKENKVSKTLIDQIQSDEDTEHTIGQKTELETKNDGSQKATFVVKYWRDADSGHIFWNKSTKYCPIRSAVDLGISRYPLAFGNWSRVKNSYHGTPVLDGFIGNQISINQMYAMVVYFMRMQAFGKVLIDSTRITSWNNQIGQVVKVTGALTDVVKQLDSGDISAAIYTVMEMMMKYTKEFLGANDVALGNIDTQRSSGQAIMLTAKQAAIPHANIQANLYQFIEDLYLIWGEFYFNKYKNRTLYYKDGEKTRAEQYSSDGLENILLSCKVNVGPSNTYNDIVSIQNLDNLLQGQFITKLQYYERIKDMNVIPDVQGLITEEKEAQMAAQAQKAAEQEQLKLAAQTPGGTLITGANASVPTPQQLPSMQGNKGNLANNSKMRPMGQ